MNISKNMSDEEMKLKQNKRRIEPVLHLDSNCISNSEFFQISSVLTPTKTDILVDKKAISSGELMNRGYIPYIISQIMENSQTHSIK